MRRRARRVRGALEALEAALAALASQVSGSAEATSAEAPPPAFVSRSVTPPAEAAVQPDTRRAAVPLSDAPESRPTTAAGAPKRMLEFERIAPEKINRRFGDDPELADLRTWVFPA